MIILSSPEHDVDVSHHLSVLQLWHRYLLLSTWLSSSGEIAFRLRRISLTLHSQETHPPFGRALTSRQLASSRHDDDVRPPETFVAILSIVQAELGRQRTSGAENDLSPVIATYLVFSSFCQGSGESGCNGVVPIEHNNSSLPGLDELDNCLAKMCRLSTPPEFMALLDLVFNGFSSRGLSEANTGDLIHVSDVMMRNAPEGVYSSRT